jgi:hypothetical protein
VLVKNIIEENDLLPVANRKVHRHRDSRDD